MSLKWRRSRQWDDEHFPAWAWPAKALLRAFSSIPLAVALLSLIVVYAILASVPIGLLALAPTYLFYGITLVLTVLAGAVLPVLAFVRATRGIGRRWWSGSGASFAVVLMLGLGLAVLGAMAWRSLLWPALQYDPLSGRGVRFLASFCDRYKAVTLRRLPGLEMSELEFYSWWPLRVILVAFVVNMIVATVRRIEFIFVNLGVLTVHTGIVVIALGSLYYKGLKLEGDTLLFAGEPGPDGVPTAGAPQRAFYDNTLVSLWVSQRNRGGHWEQRPLAGVPRYNDYDLRAAGGPTLLEAVGRAPDTSTDAGRRLSVSVARPPAEARAGGAPVDADISFRIVGYATYAEPALDWIRSSPDASGSVGPAWLLSLHSELPDEAGHVSDAPIAGLFFLPDRPARRSVENEAFGIEFFRGASEARWAELATELPPGTDHALLVEVPGPAGTPNAEAFRAVYPVRPGQEQAIGTTGYTLRVEELLDRPPFPIITPGYRDADSSVAIVRVNGPGPSGTSYQRWVYHRFPEISQDMLEERNAQGMPLRRDADPGIRITYLDASRRQVFIDERPDGAVRAIVREPGGRVTALGGLAPGGEIPIVEKVRLRLAERWPGVVEFERPAPVSEGRRDNSEVGTHSRAFLGVEVSVPRPPAGPDGAPREGWRRVVWLPFTRYLGVGMGTERTLALPDGRTLDLAFGRRLHALPGFLIQLVDFQAIMYEHGGPPRDYQSIVRVVPTGGPAGAAFEAYEHVTRLNAPLQAPFMWSEGRSWLANAIGKAASRLSPRQFKFSQSGWDSEGWERTRALAEQGQLPRAYATYTILGVGNNPGIHVIAGGAILVAVGIPWAFYVKPMILRMRKRRLRREIEDSEVRFRSDGAARAPKNEPVGGRV